MDDIKNYYEVITEVWKFFKKYYAEFDGELALADIYKFEEHFKQKKYGPRVYDIAMRTIRMYWQEAGEVHEIKKNREGING